MEKAQDTEMSDEQMLEPESADPNAFGARPACFKNTFQEIAFVLMATIALATNSFLAGSTVIVTASIGKDLGMSQSQISWISAAPSLTAGAFQLALGQLSDLLGRKPAFVTGMLCFSAGSLIVAFAQNPFWMDILCGILGLFSAVVVPPAVGILGAAYQRPSKRKNLAFACFSAGNPLGFAAGSIVCGIATRLFDWRASFILLAILWAVLGVLSLWIVPSIEAFEPAPFGGRLKLALKTFDVLGTLFTVLGVGFLTTALTLGASDGWVSPEVLGMLIGGCVLLVAFVFWESYCSNPLMPLRIWRDRNFSLLMLTTAMGMMSYFSSSFWLTLLMQEVLYWNALDIAVHLLPQVIAGIVWNIVAANILHRVSNKLIMGIGALAYVGSNLLLTFNQTNSLYWIFIFPALVLSVVGADFQFNVANMYVMETFPSDKQSLAGGIFNMLIRLSSTIAIGVSTAVYSSVEETQSKDDDAMRPYRMAIYVSVGLSAAACFFIPFLTIKTQGNTIREKVESQDS